jgi:hypothetical protein
MRLHRSVSTIAVALLFSLIFGSNAFAYSFAPGDVISYSQDDWGYPSTTGSNLLLANYYDVYASSSGVLEVGIPGTGGFSMLFPRSGCDY